MKAKEIIGNIDKKDTPFIAVALSFKNNGIWFNDKHLKGQSEVKIFSTRELIIELGIKLL